jgi:hypothetical protein
VSCLDCNELVLHGTFTPNDSGWLEYVSDCTHMLVCNHKAQFAPANLSVCTWTGIDSAHAIACHCLQASVDSSSGWFSPSSIFLHIAILLRKRTKKQSNKHLQLPAGFAQRPMPPRRFCTDDFCPAAHVAEICLCHACQSICS